MPQSTETKQKELLNTQSSTETTLNSEYLVTNEPIEGTPFRLLGTEEKGYTIALSQYILTGFSPSREEALSMLKLQKWNITINAIIALIKIDQNQKF